MKKNTLILLVVFLINTFLFAQDKQTGKIFKGPDIVKSDGINYFDKWNTVLGSDSIRKDDGGAPYQGWVEDLYETGQIAHTGFYADGHVNTYKNYYEDGTEERTFMRSNEVKSRMKKNYPNSKLKSDIEYFNRTPIEWKELYNNGDLKYTQMSGKTKEYLVSKKAYYQGKKPQLLMELTNPKELLYAYKEFSESGQVTAEGQLKFNSETKNYDKVGDWKSSDIAKNASVLSPAVAQTKAADAVGVLPDEFKPADKNKDGAIAPDEISASIDAFFDGDSNYSAAIIVRMIDFFFQQ